MKEEQADRRRPGSLGRDMLLILAGTFLMAAAINLVYDPMGMVTGGVTGLAIIVKFLTAKLVEGGIPVWLMNLLCNVPLFLVALHRKGIRYLARTLFATLMLSFALFVLPVRQLFDDFLLATLFGAVLTGVGVGLVFAATATTGGTDLFCALIHEKKQYYSIPKLLAVVDGSIVAVGAVVFGLNSAMYALIVVYLSAKISDNILEGLKFAKMAYIISDHAEEIAEEIMRTLDRGVTALDARGMYSGQNRTMLYCVVSKKQIVEVIRIVHRLDPKAFVTVNDVREVMGEGFIEFRQ